MLGKQILILGATGRTAKLLLRQMMDCGYEVNVLIRDTEKMVMHQKISVFDRLQKAAMGTPGTRRGER